MQRLVLAVAAAFVVFLAPSTPAAEVLIPSKSTWRFLPGTGEASNPVWAWRGEDFSDTTWPPLPAPFAYGEPDFQGTDMSGMQNRYTTFFLRHSFTITNTSTVDSLTLRAVIDDGFHAWINGSLVASDNAPADPTISSVAITFANEPAQYTDHVITDTSMLRAGTNVLAVMVLNSASGSSDIVFDAELLLQSLSTEPLRIDQVAPTPGFVSALSSIEVVFSEAVREVRATDLLLNGRSATSLSGSGSTYTFSFPQPAYGSVTIGWDPANTIATVANPPRRILSSTPGSTWSYELLDPDQPSMVSTLPLADSVVRNASEAEVMFNKAVGGVDATDLLVNGQPATNVLGLGAGPYRFFYAPQPAGTVTFTFAADHGIYSDVVVPQPFAGGSWSCTVNPASQPADIVLNEFVAENQSGLRDEEGDLSSWIEVWNRGTGSASLRGWSLSDDPNDPGQWVFPNIIVPAGGYRIVFASGKNRRPAFPGGTLHTNFKLSTQGEFLGLFSPDAPRQPVDQLQPAYPPQAPDHSFGRSSASEWKYFTTPSPAASNGLSSIVGRVEPVHFSAASCFYNQAFDLALDCPTPGAVIRYTLNASIPTEQNGILYTKPIRMNTMRVVRAAAFKKNHLPSEQKTRTYIYILPTRLRNLPVLSIVTATNNLYGPSGIMEPPNPAQHGIAWERPATVELFGDPGFTGFYVNCGLRVAGGDYIRPLLDYRASSPPYNKYSFRLYFRGDYGPGRLRYPWFPTTTLDSFDRITLRAGMNDPTNPFIRDEFIRRLEANVGQVASHGTFVNLFLNGRYQGYYNPAEHIDETFLADYHGTTNAWDIVDQSEGWAGAREGDTLAWNQLRNFVNNTPDLSTPANYLQLSRQLDLTNFVDYLLPLTYGDVDDWPHNNWRAARERVAGAPFRFYAWDAEFSFGYSGSVSHDTIANQLSSTAPPWGGTQIQTIFNRLKLLPEFRLLFADRVHKHLFNNGALTDPNIAATYNQVYSAVATTIPTFDHSIATSWIPARRGYWLGHLQQAGFLASSNAPTFSQFGGRVPAGYPLSLSRLAGTIYYTTNGTDPRTPFTGAIAPSAIAYSQPITLDSSIRICARTRSGPDWSALADASFLVGFPGQPIRITEIMYNPPGGDAYEFVELLNLAPYPINLQDYSLAGLDFRFPIAGPMLPANGRFVIASALNPAAFATRYPTVTVAGYFGGSLANGGETLSLLNPAGDRMVSVPYDDASPWPAEADGSGASLEIIDPRGAPDDPANWRASTTAGGSPGQLNPAHVLPDVRFSEALALPDSAGPDWIELVNAGATTANLAGWTLRDPAAGRTFTFPANTTLPPGGFLLVYCDPDSNDGALHAGFALDAGGEVLALHDTSGSRIDVLSFGPQVAGRSVARLAPGNLWDLAEPTPLSANEPATLAPPTSLALNELLANPPPGQEDWIEIYNRSATLPASLHNCQISVGNRAAPIHHLTFVPPGGFLLLHADGNAGPDHLDLKLPASGGRLILHSNSGTELDALEFGAQAENVSRGRLPDGSATVVAFAGSSSPGASNYLLSYAGPVLNEILARGQSPTGPAGDWLELFNPRALPFDLSGLSLRPDATSDRSWTFPAGSTLGPQELLVVTCNPDLPASTLASATPNTGFALDGNGATIQLVDAANRVVGSVTYGNQAGGLSIGLSGNTWQLLATPTPGSPNANPATLGDPASLRLNEWMAQPANGDDWFEIFNPDTLPVSLSGLYLTDDPSIPGQTNTLIGPLTFAAPGGFALWTADGQTNRGPMHAGFSLDAQGETLRLLNADHVILDSVSFPAQQVGASEGRWPDGTTNILRFINTPSPALSNYLPIRGVALNELLTHTDPPLEDAIELANLTPNSIPIGGWFLSDRADHLQRWRIPDGATLPAHAFRVFYEYQFNASPGTSNSFELDSAHGGTLYLSAANPDGSLTGFRTSVDFPATANGSSLGHIQTSAGPDLSPLTRHTFGIESPSTLIQFRTGNGSPNATPLVGPVVLSEIMFHPPSGPTDEATAEFLEIHNSSPTAVHLFDPSHPTNTWRLRGGVEFDFPPNLSLPANATWLLVGFNPNTDPDRLAAFRSRYGLGTSVPVLGPFAGRLSNTGEELRLQRPDRPQGPDRPDAGFVPYLQVDRVRYGIGGAWPATASATGFSLQRRSALLYGNEPLHWLAAAPTPGGVSTPATEADRDQDGLPDGWETLHLLDPEDPADAASDLDEDGLTALEEYRLGTDPGDPADNLQLVILADEEEYVLRFIARPDRTYTVEYTDDPAAGLWYKLLDVPAGTAPEQIELGLTRAVQPTPRYFRIVSPGRF